VNAIHAGSAEADSLQGIKRDSLGRYLHPFFRRFHGFGEDAEQ
jgi:hypothetical protein